MRKNSPRKWLHAVLDLLPVILIPVFMIYSHRHTIDSGSIQVPQNQVVDFNQLIDEDFVLESVGVRDGVTITYDNHHLLVASGETTNGTNIGITDRVLVPNHIYIYRYLYDLEGFNLLAYNLYDVVFIASSGTTSTTERFSLNSSYDSNFYLYFNVGSSGVNVSVETIPQLFDLTQMFGSGNEPTIEQFNQWYSNDYYEYTLSHKELLKNTSSITYSDTDIMSQFTYQLYNSVDKYFNMGNVFNMNGIYDWFNLNIFNGNAPISIYIVWNIVLYEFVMDLLFLLYGLFMWFIDMVQHLMDKPFKSIK